MLHGLLVGLLCSLPHWLALLHNGGDYSPFSVSPSVSALIFDETHAYAPAARRLALTGRMAAETDNYEHRNLTAGIPFLPEAMLGEMGALFGNIERAFITADVVFPPLAFLLLYLLTSSVLSNGAFRLLVAWSTLVIPFGLLNTFWMGDDALIAPLEITRTPQPEISFVVLLAALWLLARSLVEKHPAQWLLGAGLASGAVVYCYYFYAIAWGITLGLLLLFGLLWNDRSLGSRSGAVLALMLPVSIPYAFTTIRGNKEGGQADLLARMGIHSRQPDVIPLVAAVIFTVILLLFAKTLSRSRPAYFVLAILVCGALYGMNIQIVTGYETQQWHFWKRLALPACFFLSASAIGYLAEHAAGRRARTYLLGAHALLALLIVDTAARLSYAAIKTAPFERASRPDTAMLNWIRTSLPHDQVIGTVNPELILLIPAMTTDYTYVPSGLRSLTSNDEIVGRYFEMACLLGLSDGEVARAAAIPNHLGHSTELLHVLGLSYSGDAQIYRSLVARYREFHMACTPPRWRLDLIITASQQESAAIRQKQPLTKMIYKNSRYELLAVR